jgi:triphosphoribosyl-dephospho-CoA synthetase
MAFGSKQDKKLEKQILGVLGERDKKKMGFLEKRQFDDLYFLSSENPELYRQYETLAGEYRRANEAALRGGRAKESHELMLKMLAIVSEGSMREYGETRGIPYLQEYCKHKILFIKALEDDNREEEERVRQFSKAYLEKYKQKLIDAGLYGN